MFAIASTKLLGNTWVIKLAKLNDPAFTATGAEADWCRSIFKPTPGWNRFTNSKPTSNETKEAVTNHAIARKPMLLTALDCPIDAMPHTNVANTNGPIIILIRRRNTSEISP
ncbi:hypothetical protein D3C80_1818240 [compost metagenome]